MLQVRLWSIPLVREVRAYHGQSAVRPWLALLGIEPSQEIGLLAAPNVWRLLGLRRPVLLEGHAAEFLIVWIVVGLQLPLRSTEIIHVISRSRCGLR